MKTMTLEKVYGVIDLGCEDAAVTVRALGCDVVELVSALPVQRDGTDCYRVEVRSLHPDQLVRLCRVWAARNGLSDAGAFFEAIQGAGLWLAGSQVFVCHDPAEGRAFFAARDRSGGAR